MSGMAVILPVQILKLSSRAESSGVEAPWFYESAITPAEKQVFSSVDTDCVYCVSMMDK
jgi:hypothetical protein